MDIAQLKKDRFNFLKVIYEAANANTSYMFDMWEVGRELNFDHAYTGAIADYLIGEGLIESRALGGGIGLAHEGIKEIEQALSSPTKPTLHFIPVNQINIGTMHNSAIQQATTNSTQNFHVTTNHVSELRELINELKAVIGKAEFPKEQREELQAEITTLEAQSNSPKPKSSIILETLKSAKAILEHVPAILIAEKITHSLPQLIAYFSGN